MKRVIVLTVSILYCFLVYSQEADNYDKSAVVSIITRLDCNPHIKPTLYSSFEGNISRNLSLYICNHWLSDAPAELYRNTLHSDNLNWVDFANITYHINRFYVKAGKDMIPATGLENDENDYDAHSEMLSSFWNYSNSYQWGLSAGYTSQNKKNSFSIQISASPFGIHPFTSGLYCYSGEWRGSYGVFRTIWSANAIETQKGQFQYVITLGQEVSIRNFKLGIDYMNKVGDEDNIISDGTSIFVRNSYVSDNKKFEAKLNIGMDKHAKLKPTFLCGIALHWFPFNNKSLRLHIVTGYNTKTKIIWHAIGAIYYFNLKVF